MYKIYKLIPIVLLIAGICLQSCSKTEYDYLKRPYNEIKQFSITGSTGETTKCLISGDSITVYWNPDVTLPATISPNIVIDDKAKISPASGTPVPFNKSTVYTVTAENGEVKTYKLNPLLKLPVPSISSVQGPITWLNYSQLSIFGEYFLANTQPSEIKAYLQRVSDGFEFPLELVTNKITNYSIVANLPQFSAELDTGLHKLYIKTGTRVAKGADVRFLTPYISNANPVSNLVQDGQAIHTGDELSINYSFSDNYGGKVASYYHAKNIDYVLLYMAPSYEWVTIKDGITVTDKTVKVKVPNVDKYIGQTLAQYRFIYKSVPPASATSSSYFLRGFLNSTTPIKAKTNN